MLPSKLIHSINVRNTQYVEETQTFSIRCQYTVLLPMATINIYRGLVTSNHQPVEVTRRFR